jgi:aspartyl-tRNA(Asn)/glutamyl-tRNA(Gln) amidotransferase subunit C
VTKSEAIRIAALARLDLPDADLDRLARELTDILTFAGQIADVDTQSVASIARMPTDAPVLRVDEVRSSLPTDEATAQAPDTDAGRGLFKVPGVLG